MPVAAVFFCSLSCTAPRLVSHNHLAHLPVLCLPAPGGSYAMHPLPLTEVRALFAASPVFVRQWGWGRLAGAGGFSAFFRVFQVFWKP